MRRKFPRFNGAVWKRMIKTPCAIKAVAISINQTSSSLSCLTEDWIKQVRNRIKERKDAALESVALGVSFDDLRLTETTITHFY